MILALLFVALAIGAFVSVIAVSGLVGQRHPDHSLHGQQHGNVNWRPGAFWSQDPRLMVWGPDILAPEGSVPHHWPVGS